MTLLAVQHVRCPTLFLGRDPQNHDLALVKIDPQPGHTLETEQKKFEISNLNFLGLDHDNRVVRKLHMGHRPALGSDGEPPH
jgi:hypothetical protein